MIFPINKSNQSLTQKTNPKGNRKSIQHLINESKKKNPPNFSKHKSSTSYPFNFLVFRLLWGHFLDVKITDYSFLIIIIIFATICNTFSNATRSRKKSILKLISLTTITTIQFFARVPRSEKATPNNYKKRKKNSPRKWIFFFVNIKDFPTDFPGFF